MWCIEKKAPTQIFPHAYLRGFVYQFGYNTFTRVKVKSFFARWQRLPVFSLYILLSELLLRGYEGQFLVVLPAQNVASLLVGELEPSPFDRPITLYFMFSTLSSKDLKLGEFLISPSLFLMAVPIVEKAADVT